MTRDDLIRTPEWRQLFQTIPVMRDFFSGDPDSHGIRELLRGVSIYMEKIVHAVDQEHPFVWYNLGFNSEIVYAFENLTPTPIEGFGAMHNILGDINTTLDLIDTAEAAGVPNDCCSADRIGAGTLHKGLYPSPACCIGINTPCDAQVLATQVMAEVSGKPFFVIDVPYYPDDRTVKHVASQLAELVPFMEKSVGQKLDYDRLRHACELSNQMTEAIWEWLEWRKHVPLTQSSKFVSLTLILQIMFAGTQEGVDIARGLLREARERTQRGEHFFEERARAVWYQDPVWTDMQIYDWFEHELGLTVPIDVFGYYAQDGLIDTKTPESMLYGLARKMCNCHPMARQFRSDIDVYLNDFLHIHEAWNADCGIFAGHISCKHAWGGIGLLKEACKKADIPLLIFEFDMFDPRITPYEDVYFQVERFVNEIVVPKKLRG